MPVLYVALGRRLGYPLKLVATKAHLFIRWEDAKERFDLEATGKGMNRYDDEHFKQWPFPTTDEEIREEGYLKSLSPAEELAVFLSIRAHCLLEAGWVAEAVTNFEASFRLAPGWRSSRELLADARQKLSSGWRPGLAPLAPPPIPQPAFERMKPGRGHTEMGPDPNPSFQGSPP